jgi:hypothetical protein
MGERRGIDRVVLDAECELAIEGRAVRARMMNYSDIGALFTISGGGPDAVSDDDLGSDAVFVHPAFRPPRRYTGEIIRRYYLGGVLYIAVRFWSPYTSLPG